VLGDESIQHLGQIVGGDGSFDFNGEALSGEDVDDVEQFERLAISSLIKLEVHRPDGVGADRTHGTHVGPDAAQGLLRLR